jgi:hypothetical protein
VPWRPSEPGEVPTLGWTVIDWIAEFLAAPDRGEYEPFVLYREQEDFVLRFYELDPVTGRRRRRRGVYSRPRGAGKSPFLAALALAEALAPVVPDGWDAEGQPVGRPWSTVRTPLVQILAVSEKQTANTWSPLLEMCDGPLLDAYPGLEPLDTFVNLPRGRIEPITSSARTVKGNRPVFAVLDQTEEWVPSNGGPNLFEKVKNNTAKVGGTFVESPNAFTPGDESVAEASANFWRAIESGHARDDGLYYDHREAPAETELDDRESLVAGLRVAYGDSSGHPDGCVLHDPPCPPGHVDLDHLVATIWDPTSDPQVSCADFLNQVTHAADAYLSQPEWRRCADAAKVVAGGDVVTLGFDGSRGRAKGKPDATALIGVRVHDGHVFELGVWEAPDRKEDWPKWEPPIVEIEAAIADAFQRYAVVGFYADPAKDWRSHVNKWEAAYGGVVKVKAGRDHPFEWWMTGGRSGLIQRAVEQFEGAVKNRDMTHDGSWALTRHVLQARRRIRHQKLTIGKESDYSPKKIDAAVAAVLAWQARLDAVAAGLGKAPEFVMPRRLR